MTTFATGIATAFHFGYNVTLTNSVVPLLAVVVSHSELRHMGEGIHTTGCTGWFDPCVQEHVRVFKNSGLHVILTLQTLSTSYDRYYEGRKDFGSMMSTVSRFTLTHCPALNNSGRLPQIRNLARLVWVNVNVTKADLNSSLASSSKFCVPPGHQGSAGDRTPLTSETLKHQKKRTLQLLLAYAYAVKHHLRGEDGTDWPDYKDVLPASFARFNETGLDRTANTSYSSINSADKGASAGKEGCSGRKKVWNTQEIPSDASAPLLTDAHQTVEFHPYADGLSLPLPMMCAPPLCS